MKFLLGHLNKETNTERKHFAASHEKQQAQVDLENTLLNPQTTCKRSGLMSLKYKEKRLEQKLEPDAMIVKHYSEGIKHLVITRHQDTFTSSSGIIVVIISDTWEG